MAGVVALVAWRIPALRGRAVWAATIAAEVAILLQVVLGVAMFTSGDYPGLARFHMFYGFVAFVTVALAYSYRAQLKGRVEMLYGFTGLFLMGVGIRAVLQVT